MDLGRPKAPLALSPEQREQLQALVSSRCLPHGLVTWVPSVLMSADGCSNRAIAAQLGLAQATVGKWRRRFLEQGVTRLYDELRPGRAPRGLAERLKREGSVVY